MLANQIIASCNAESSRLHLKYILRNQHIHKFFGSNWLLSVAIETIIKIQIRL